MDGIERRPDGLQMTMYYFFFGGRFFSFLPDHTPMRVGSVSALRLLPGRLSLGLNLTDTPQENTRKGAGAVVGLVRSLSRDCMR